MVIPADETSIWNSSPALLRSRPSEMDRSRSSALDPVDSEPLAVMVWIHGGGFTLGSKDLYRMGAIIRKDVILVAMNYRLHALGFLSFGNKLVR